MINAEQIPTIISKIQQLLAEAAETRKAHLQVLHTDHKLEDDWLYVCVSPTEPGERASDHAELMSEIERKLQDSGADNVLLIPTLPE